VKLLSALDALFLHLETPEQPMHVGGLNTFTLPPLAEKKSKKVPVSFYQDVRDHLVSRMHLAPIFKRRLATMPMGLTNPAWHTVDTLDLDWHIQHVQLNKPGSFKQLEAFIAKAHAELLPRDRPLWRAYVIEGLSSGEVGFFAKFHHAALDGQGGVALAKAILDLEAKPVDRTKKESPDTLKGKAKVSTGALLAASFRGLLGQYTELVRAAPQMTSSLAGAIASFSNTNADSLATTKTRQFIGPKTRLNVAISKHRAFATLNLPVTEVKAIGKAVGGSLNDAVLGIVSGGLRLFLNSHNELPKKSLICAMPVSLRTEAHANAANIENQSSMVLTSLATDVVDPIERLRTIIEGTVRAKELSAAMKNGMPTDMPSLGIPWLLTGLTQLYTKSKLANHLPPVANVMVSNVLGPPVPLYMAGAAMTSYYPVSIVVHGIALNITLQSYAGQLGFGIIACKKAVPDVTVLAQFLEQAFQELKLRCALLSAEVTASVAAPQTVKKPIPANKRTPKKQSLKQTVKPTTKKVVAKKTSVAVKKSKTTNESIQPKSKLATRARTLKVSA
jgi:diacylglycerol O-acyltransferase / wax synthase